MNSDAEQVAQVDYLIISVERALAVRPSNTQLTLAVQPDILAMRGP